MRQESQSPSVTKSELIAGWCERLGHGHGRNPKAGLVRIWQERLAPYSEEVLTKAFWHIEGHDDKFPSTARCIEVCGLMSPNKHTPFYPETTDPKGVRCWRDPENGEFLYRAPDCPEGQQFLKTLAQVAQKIAMP